MDDIELTRIRSDIGELMPDTGYILSVTRAGDRRAPMWLLALRQRVPRREHSQHSRDYHCASGAGTVHVLGDARDNCGDDVYRQTRK